jgi:oxygen-independent coproporphyrinogen-3 oxidase
MPYLGLGLGAQSFTHRTISYNDGSAGKNLAPYAKSVAAGRLPVQDLYDLPLCQMMGKFCAVSFYFGEIDAPSFQAKFGVSLATVFASEIAFAVDHGLMEWHGPKLRLTSEGAGVVEGVIALFFAPSIQGYLKERDAATASDLHRHRRAALAVAGARAGDGARAGNAAGEVEAARA